MTKLARESDAGIVLMALSVLGAVVSSIGIIQGMHLEKLRLALVHSLGLALNVLFGVSVYKHWYWVVKIFRTFNMVANAILLVFLVAARTATAQPSGFLLLLLIGLAIYIAVVSLVIFSMTRYLNHDKLQQQNGSNCNV